MIKEKKKGKNCCNVNFNYCYHTDRHIYQPTFNMLQFTGSLLIVRKTIRTTVYIKALYELIQQVYIIIKLMRSSSVIHNNMIHLYESVNEILKKSVLKVVLP